MQELTFWDHLEELRSVIFRILGVIALLSIGFFWWMPNIFDTLIMGPCFGNFPTYRFMQYVGSVMHLDSSLLDSSFQLSIINIKLTSQFMVHLQTSMLLALVVGFPYLFFEIWRYIAPALLDKEKKSIKLSLFLGSTLFYIGLIVGYYVVFPTTLRFLAGYEITSLVSNQLSLDSYISTFVSLIFIMGIVFEIPVLAMILSGLGLIKRPFFKKYRRYAIVVLVTLAAIITPTGDPFTLALVSFPLLGLYELSAILVKKH